jgi:hypothetical protein
MGGEQAGRFGKLDSIDALHGEAFVRDPQRTADNRYNLE